MPKQWFASQSVRPPTHHPKSKDLGSLWLCYNIIRKTNIHWKGIYGFGIVQCGITCLFKRIQSYIKIPGKGGGGVLVRLNTQIQRIDFTQDFWQYSLPPDTFKECVSVSVNICQMVGLYNVLILQGAGHFTWLSILYLQPIKKLTAQSQILTL